MRFGTPLMLGTLLFAAGCGSSSYNKNATNAAAPATQPAALASASGSAPGGATTKVDIKNTAFPATISVKPSTTVTWTDQDSFQHSITADAGQGESFDSKPLDPGTSFSMTFARAGTYAYHCSIHASMHGTVVVSDRATGVSTPAANGVPGYGY